MSSLKSPSCLKINNKGWIRVLRFILPYLLITATFQFIGCLVLGIDPVDIDAEKTSFQDLVIIFFNLLGVFASVWIFNVTADKEPFSSLGFQRKHFFKAFGSGFGIGVLAIVCGFLLLIGLNEIQVEKMLFDPLEIILTTVLFLFVAIAEEVVFRGYILRNLLISFNKYVALVISAILFTALHLINPHINLLGAISLICAGLLCGIAFIYTKNLWLPIALHFSWNLFQTMLGFNVSGQDVYSIISFQTTDNSWINGGSFGFEGSIISVGIQVLIILGIVVFYRLKKV